MSKGLYIEKSTHQLTELHMYDMTKGLHVYRNTSAPQYTELFMLYYDKGLYNVYQTKKEKDMH